VQALGLAATGLTAIGALAACASTTDGRPRAVDLDSTLHDPLDVPRGRVHVLVFTSHECPIANAYAETLRELAAGWRSAPVSLFLVHVDPDLSVAAAREHARAFDLPGTILLDPTQGLARAVGITKTPEAAVLISDELAYRGRIDDAWQALGTRSAVGQRDLAMAVARASRGERTPLPHPPAVGCLLPEARTDDLGGAGSGAPNR
jgi:hypothetical protein